MKIRVENITYNFGRYNPQFEDVHLGDANLGIPYNMLKRFIKECGFEGILPHYSSWDMEFIEKDSTHNCVNPDTQIILMHWLHDKRRNYKLDYNGVDPYWIYHDYCHSQGDVYSYEVGHITSWKEHYRLMEGAEMSRHYGHFIKAETLVEINKAWGPRWDYKKGAITPFNPFDFKHVMTSKELDKLNILMEY
jgi:hypothetical protein